MFHATKEALDEVAMLVLMLVEVALHDAISLGRDPDRGASLFDRLYQRIGIERLIGDHSLGLDALQQRRRLRQIVRLPSPSTRTVNPSGQSAPRSLDRRFFGSTGSMLVGSLPTSVTLPGSISSMRAYWSSRRIFRGIAQTLLISWNNSLNVIVNRI